MNGQTVCVNALQLQMLICSPMHADAQEVFRAATEAGIAVVQTADLEDACESVKKWKFDGIVVDARVPESEKLVQALLSSNSNSHVPMMCLLPPLGSPAHGQRPSAAIAVPTPVTAHAMATTMRLLCFKMMGERRRYFRCRVDFEVRCTQGPTTQTVRAIDISRGGMAVAGILRVSDLVNIRFTLPGQKHEVSATAQVVWAKNDRAAVRFLSLTPAGKKELDNWLRVQCDHALGTSDIMNDRPKEPAIDQPRWLPQMFNRINQLAKSR